MHAHILNDTVTCYAVKTLLWATMGNLKARPTFHHTFHYIHTRPLCVKGIVHPKVKVSLIIYSPPLKINRLVALEEDKVYPRDGCDAKV